MNTQAKLIIGLLVAVVAALGITVGVLAAGTGGDDGNDGMATHMDTDDAYMGMMGAMGGMDSDNMLEHMREILGEDGYNRMMGHFQDHRNGTMTGDAEVDGMMHRMMDGMMQHMPQDNQDVLPPGVDQHHEPPVAGTPSN